MVTRGKKATRIGQDSIKTMYETYNQQVRDVIKIKDSQIKRLNANLQQYTPDIEEDSTKQPVSLESLRPILEERGINPAILTNPFVQKYIKKYTKGMGIDEILALAEQFGLLKGNQQSKDQALGYGSATWDPNSA